MFVQLMELYTIILTLTVVLSTDAEFEHEGVQFVSCSNTEDEFFIGFDEEELWHADLNQNTGVVTTPDFTGPLTFAGFYERADPFLARCKSDLENYIEDLKSPPSEMDPPHTSIYSKDDVHMGVQNTLICHVTGFYPPSVRVTWSKNNINITEGISFSQYRPMKDGTFNIFSTLKFTPIEGDIYSCTVNHKALQGRPQTKIWDVEVAVPGFGPALLCGVGLTIGLVGIAAGTFLFIKGKNGK